MWKYFAVVLIVVFSGCSNIEFNAAMCEKIASDPNAVMPQECRNYSEEEAQKAFDKTNTEKFESKEDIIKFNRDEDEKED
jgi:uncharacterized ion transporter superfamily protein YfcC